MVGKTDQARTAGLLDAPMAPGTRVTVSISEAQLEKILKADEKGKAAPPLSQTLSKQEKKQAAAALKQATRQAATRAVRCFPSFFCDFQ